MSLIQTHWRDLAGLDFDGADFNATKTFARYDKIEFVKSISKIGMELIKYSSFSPL